MRIKQPMWGYGEIRGDLTLSLGSLGASAYVVANDAPATVKVHAQQLYNDGFPVWICDGVADNIDIQAAINAVNASGKHGKVELIGDIFYCATTILAKTDVDVEGHGAELLVAGGHCGLDVTNIINSVWSNITVRLNHTATGTESYSCKVLGNSVDKTVKFRNCRFINDISAGTSNYHIGLFIGIYGDETQTAPASPKDVEFIDCYAEAGKKGNSCGGIVIYGSSYPKLVRCTGVGFGTVAPDNAGIQIAENAHPTLEYCKGIGSTVLSGGIYLSDSDGIAVWDNASPTLISCIGKGGLGGASPAFNLGMSGSPKMLNCSNELWKDSYQVPCGHQHNPQWNADEQRDEFLPFADQAYQVLNCFVWVLNYPTPRLLDNSYLDIGTAPTGENHDSIVKQLPCRVGGVQAPIGEETRWAFNRVQVPANTRIYMTWHSGGRATIGGVLQSLYITVLFTVCKNNQTGSIIALETGGGFPEITGGSFIAQGALVDGVLGFKNPGGKESSPFHLSSVKARIQGVKLEHLGVLPVLHASAPISNIKMSDCSLIGTIGIHSTIKSFHEEVYETYIDTFTNILAKDTNYIVAAEALNQTAPFDCTIAHQPDCPRNLTLTITDINTSISAFDIFIYGKDAKGKRVQEAFSFAGGLTQTGNVAFSRVDVVRVSSITGAGQGDVLDIGIGAKLGLRKDILLAPSVEIGHYIKSNQALNGTIPITFGLDNYPDTPRTLVWSFDSHANISAYTLEIEGRNEYDEMVTESWTEAKGWSGETDTIFTAIYRIRMTARTGTGDTDTMDIGVGTKRMITDILSVTKNGALYVFGNYTVDTTYGTVDVSTGEVIQDNDDFSIWYRSNTNKIMKSNI